MVTAPTPNAELAYRVLDQIDADPKSWDQSEWYREEGCGTVACFAGWAVKFGGYDIALSEEQPALFGIPAHRFGRYVHGVAGRRSFPYVAAEILRIDIEQADDLFDGSNTRENLGLLVAEIFGPRPHAPLCVDQPGHPHDNECECWCHGSTT